MTWAEVCDNPILQDLPFKIELNKWGNIEMSPARSRHGDYQAEIAYLLRMYKPDGRSGTEVGVDTTENTKVPDVIWASFERRRLVPHELSWTSAPEICVEIISPSNWLEEQMLKGQLYFQAGAEEFWLCDENGNMQFFDTNSRLERSRLCPEFPTQVTIPD